MHWYVAPPSASQGSSSAPLRTRAGTCPPAFFERVRPAGQRCRSQPTSLRSSRCCSEAALRPVPSIAAAQPAHGNGHQAAESGGAAQSGAMKYVLVTGRLLEAATTLGRTGRAGLSRREQRRHARRPPALLPAPAPAHGLPGTLLCPTGGVVSGLGKGVTASSIGVLLKACGHRVTSIKIGASQGAPRRS